MISLIVDEAYAFDYLSILEVKNLQLGKGFQEFRNCENVLMAQLGNDRFFDIRSSTEYGAMLQANLVVFKLVEQLKTDPTITSFEVDHANKQRYLCKKALQAKFFGTELKEEKTYARH